MTMKRIIRQDGEIDTLTTANCFMLLSQLGFAATTLTGGSGRVFACKTCNREFPSFQALGGHRASHKKPRLAVRVQAQKLKRHECSICGIEFATGQALGGHTRRHRRRDVVDDDTRIESVEVEVEVEVAMMMKSSSSSKRVLCLDLNLTPYENHMKITKTSTDTITESINF